MSKTAILIPTYNERENVSDLVPKIMEAHPAVGIFVIDDNSPDGTGDAVKKLIAKYPTVSLISRPKKEGLGAAYKEGIEKALKTNPDRVVLMDADGSHDVKYLAPIIAASGTHEFVIGSRYVRGGRVGKWVLWRRILSRCGNWYARTVAGLSVRDMTAGFLCFKAELLRRMDINSVGASGYAFLMDLKYRAIVECKASVIEIPIELQSRREGESKISSHIIGEGLITPLRLRLRSLFGKRAAVGSSISCHICGSTDIRFFCKKNGYKLYDCNLCGLTFVHPIPKDLTAIYTEDYFRNVDKKNSHGYTDYDKDKEPMRRVFINALKKIEAIAPGKDIFDVGAATGYFLDVAREYGWKTSGSEISEYGANEAAKRGHKIIYGDLTKMPKLPVSDVVTMWDVLEHVEDPRSLTRAVNRMLPVGGIFAINTPDRGSVWARILGSKWQLLVPPEHVHYYATKNIKLLFKECGFEIVEISRMGKLFSMPYIFKMLWSWQRLRVWDFLARITDKSILRRLKIPINLRDNVFVLARKVHGL